MKRSVLSLIFTVLCGMVLYAPLQTWAVTVGAAAPDFVGTASNGKTYHLSELKGKIVVLEWHNQGCPFVKKHYNSGNMQKLQAKWTAKKVVWLSVISSAPGAEGYVSAQEEETYLRDKKAFPTAVLLDADGKIGRLYGAKTTPHMFVINKKGVLVYDGAIDDKRSVDPEDIKDAKNYVDDALSQCLAGKKVKISATNPYGCGVKYKEE